MVISLSLSLSRSSPVVATPGVCSLSCIWSLTLFCCCSFTPGLHFSLSVGSAVFQCLLLPFQRSSLPHLFSCCGLTRTTTTDGPFRSPGVAWRLNVTDFIKTIPGDRRKHNIIFHKKNVYRYIKVFFSLRIPKARIRCNVYIFFSVFAHSKVTVVMV